jgi:hypothetical protein
VAFDPDVATATVGPVAIHPMGAAMGRFGIKAGMPYIGVSIPDVIAGVPGPVTMLRGRGRNDFDGTRWGRTDANDDLRTRGQGAGEENSASCCKYLLLHGFCSLRGT